MINKILRIYRIGWRMKPVRQWYGSRKKEEPAEFDSYLDEAQKKPPVKGG